jgi:50S ribosomal subunit-associated GTPase HflX
MQGLPADSAVLAGSSKRVRGPLNGPMISVTPYGSRITWAVCPEAARPLLFPTLDTTVRALHPETQPRILVSDTVGFIRNLPHDLVASFRSTLDEALDASLLLHVVDAADPAFRSHIQVTKEVLEDIGAGKLPPPVILNKIDLFSRKALLERFSRPLRCPRSIPRTSRHCTLSRHFLRYYD